MLTKEESNKLLLWLEKILILDQPELRWAMIVKAIDQYTEKSNEKEGRQMLTKEEAIEIKKKLGVYKNTFLGFNITIPVIDIMKAIDEFTEKPKRKVQVGDIYKDGKGNLEIVSNIGDDYIETNRRHLYSLDGAWDDDGDEAYAHLNLDLSKTYKVVEIEDE